MVKAVILVIFFGALGLAARAESGAGPWNRAEMLYSQADFQAAASIYDSLAKADPKNAVAWYNLGNCNYRLNRIGWAILCYRKAEILEPANSDVRHNLERARSKRVDRIEPLREGWIEKNTRSAIRYLGRLQFLFAGLAVSILLSISLALRGWNQPKSARALMLSIAILAGIIALIGLIDRFWESSNQTAVLIASRVEVRTEPKTGAPVGFVVHEGTECRIADQKGDWLGIRLEDGKLGWVLSEAIGRI